MRKEKELRLILRQKELNVKHSITRPEHRKNLLAEIRMLRFVLEMEQFKEES